MRAPPPLTRSHGSVFLCDPFGAQICVWVMFILTAAATFKIRYIHKKLPTTKTGLQGTLIFFGFSAVFLWILFYFIIGSSALLTFLWVGMTLTCFTSILTFFFSSCTLISSLNSRTAVEITIQNQVTESGETTFNVADPNANPNLATVKQFAYFLALANFGILACSLSFIIIMFDCSVRIYFMYDDYFFYDYNFVFYDY